MCGRTSNARPYERGRQRIVGATICRPRADDIRPYERERKCTVGAGAHDSPLGTDNKAGRRGAAPYNFFIVRDRKATGLLPVAVCFIVPGRTPTP